MSKKLDDGRYKCEFCDYITTKEGWCKNHEKLKHGGGGVRQKGSEKSKKNVENGIVRCPDCKRGNIRLLSVNNAAEAKARGLGFKYICEKCEEVFE